MNVGFVTWETVELSDRKVFGYWANTLYLDDAIQSGWIVISIWYPLEKTKTNPLSEVRCCTADF